MADHKVINCWIALHSALPWAKTFELKHYKNKSKNNATGGPLDDFWFLVALPPPALPSPLMVLPFPGEDSALPEQESDLCIMTPTQNNLTTIGQALLSEETTTTTSTTGNVQVLWEIVRDPWSQDHAFLETLQPNTTTKQLK
jgi:hypothetical protein